MKKSIILFAILLAIVPLKAEQMTTENVLEIIQRVITTGRNDINLRREHFGMMLHIIPEIWKL